MDPKKLYKFKSGFKIKAVDEENFIIRGVFSTGGEDRHGEVIDQNGWDTKEFMENPVILLFHDHYSFPVAKCIELEKDQNGNLAGAIQFAVKEDLTGVAETAFNLYKNGFMRAFSVGFECVKIEFEPMEDKVILRENILHEISCVNVPANAGALAYAKGIDMTPIEKAVEKRKASGEDEDRATIKKDKEIDAATASKANLETIEKAARTLTEVLKALSKPDTADKAEAGAKVERPDAKHATGGNKKISVKLINRALKSLLAVKKIK